MIKTPITLQDLRRKLYVKAKAEPQWRFWGLYVHVCKMETLRAAYEMAKTNEGAAGSDGVTFQAIETQGVESFLGQIQSELQRRCYVPQRPRRREIPKEGGQADQRRRCDVFVEGSAEGERQAWGGTGFGTRTALEQPLPQRGGSDA